MREMTKQLKDDKGEAFHTFKQRIALLNSLRIKFPSKTYSEEASKNVEEFSDLFAHLLSDEE